tara:strand:+ start:1875 stop:2954 length:1080 start_codon:yes stop_codon:yes gene_type:complete
MDAGEVSDPSSMKVFTSIQSEFSCAKDGSIRDSKGNPWLIWKIVDFQRWWHAFETIAGAPLGRKLMNAAADQEEYLFEQTSFFKKGWWMKKKRLQTSLSERWTQLGWGRYEPQSNSIFSHLLAPMCSGFALAAVEGLNEERQKVQWHQLSHVQIKLELDKDERSLSQAPHPPIFTWDSNTNHAEFIEIGTVQLDFQKVEEGWTHSGERTCFLPSGLFQRLFDYVRMQGIILRPDILATWELPTGAEFSSWVPLILTSLAVDEVISQSERPIYIQDLESWQQLANAYLKPFGFGTFIALAALDGQGGVEFELPPSPNLPFTVGFLASFWQRGFGRKPLVKIQQKNENWLVQITSFLSYSD